MQARNILPEGHFESLNLEACPRSQQVMPPETPGREFPMALLVAGNVVVGVLLIGGLLSFPSWIAGVLGF